MQKQGLRAFPLSLLIALLIPFSGQAQDPDPKDLFGQGFDMMMERKFEKALPVWERLLEERPESPHVHFYVGACLHRTSDRKLEGIPHLEKAVEHAVPVDDYRPRLKKDNVPMSAHYFLADLYHLDYQFQKAIEHYKIFRKKEAEEHVKEMPVSVERKIAMCEQGLKLKNEPRNVRITNLGGGINSKYKEHSPVLNLDETTIYFTSKRLRADSSNAGDIDPGTGTYYEDIYTSYKKNGEWQEPRLLALNTEDHEATINLSKDARKLYVYKADVGNGDIFVSERTEGGLSELKRLGDHVNSDAKETHLDVSADNDVMYFTSDREGGQGGRDIYMVKKLPTGDWAKPQNLGPTINTEHNEDGPFIHPDGKTLYFSSEGHGTMGGYDIFRTQQKEDGSWKEPVNVGYPINSPDDDIYFVTSPDGKRAYYSSDFKGLKTEQTGKIEGQGGSDIYLLKFPEAEEKELTLLKGVIKPGDCENLLAGIMVMVEKKGTRELVQQLKPRTRDGVYVSTLLPGQTYTLTYMHEGEVFHTEEITVEEGSSYQEIRRAINLDTLNFDCSAGKVALAQNVQDGTGEATDGTEDGSGGEGGSGAGTDEDAGKDEGTDRVADASDESEEGKGSGKASGDLPMPEPFKRFFGYNENEVATRKEAFSSFVKGLVDRIEASDGIVKLKLEASASTVPTTTYKTNQNLARVRADNAKESLRKELAQRGIPKDAYRFASVLQRVQGPAYQGDAKEGKEKYGDYQYVKISVIE